MKLKTIAASLALAAFVPAASLAAADAPSTDPKDWASDLDTLYAAMKSVHPALHHRTDAATMDAYVERIRKEIPHATWPQYVMDLYGLLALVGDGHTAFYPLPESGPGFGTRLPIQTDVFADGAFVTGADKTYGDAVGGKIVAIDGHSMADVFRTALTHWDHENSLWVVRWLPLMLHRPGYLSGMGITSSDPSAPVTFTVEKNGARRDVAIVPVSLEQEEAAQKNGWVNARDEAKIARPTQLHGTDVPFDFVYLKDKRAVYATYNQCEDGDKETVAAFAARLFKFIEDNPTDKLIVDIRNNGGGDNYNNQPLILGMIRARRIDIPGHLFIITGRRTFSAAQNFAADAERLTQAIFVGEPTGSSPNLYGDAKQMELPKTHLHPMVSTILWQLSDPRDARVWILPDMPAPQTFADYLTGRDAALEAALAYQAPADIHVSQPNTHWMRASQKRDWPLPF